MVRNLSWNTVTLVIMYSTLNRHPRLMDVKIEKSLFTQSGALSPYTINKTDDENDQDNWVQVC